MPFKSYRTGPEKEIFGIETGLFRNYVKIYSRDDQPR